MFAILDRGGRLKIAMHLSSLALSIVIHFVVLCILIIFPLLFFNVLPQVELLTFLFEPPPPPIAPPPPTPLAQSSAKPIFNREVIKFIPPIKIPDGIPPPIEESPPFVEWIYLPESSAFAKGIGQPGSNLAHLLEISEPLPPPPLPKEKPSPPIKVGGEVQESKLVFRVDPVYPELARRARISGPVILQVMVDEEGSVAEIKILSGHILLTEAAVEAVSQWKYSPTLLNGEPLPVVATVTVIFKIK